MAENEDGQEKSEDPTGRRRQQAIDEGQHPSIAGTIAGDNTIFLAARDAGAATALGGELIAHLGEGA